MFLTYNRQLSVQDNSYKVIRWVRQALRPQVSTFSSRKSSNTNGRKVMTFNNLIIAAGLATLVFIGGCDSNDGPVEKAGENVDHAVDKTGDKIEDAGDKIKDEVNH